ncbi:MAG: choice-of-anchor L domain-containing protein [Flavobacteriales bacterium]
MRYFTVLILSIISVFPSQAQITVDTTFTSDQLVQNLLLGTGIAINGVSSFGPNSHKGQMISSDTSLTALSSGVVIGTGPLNEIFPVGGDSWFGFEEDNSGLVSDMLQIANDVPEIIGENFSLSSLYNLSGFEFDFIPYGEHLEFSYVFLSSEYEQFENYQYNDVFAYFISGPGIDGSYTNASENIALVPDYTPDLPITVSSINSFINSAWYVPMPENGVIDSRGRTKKLTIEYNGLQIGETYHIVFAIADGSDAAFDSQVLLEEGSFSAGNPVEMGNIYDINNDGLINVNDLLILTGAFGCMGTDCDGDFNDDGITSFMDVLEFLANF